MISGRLLFLSGVVIVVLGAAAVAYVWQRSGERAVAAADATSAEALLFQTPFVDLEGRSQTLEQWRGKVLVLNFWATWCPPCRAEIPEFMKLYQKHKKHGIVVVGLAVDKKDAVEAFVDEMGIDYPILIGEAGAIDLAKKAGDRLGALPFTAIIDRKGRIITTEVGGITEAKLENLIQALH